MNSNMKAFTDVESMDFMEGVVQTILTSAVQRTNRSELVRFYNGYGYLMQVELNLDTVRVFRLELYRLLRADGETIHLNVTFEATLQRALEMVGPVGEPIGEEGVRRFDLPASGMNTTQEVTDLVRAIVVPADQGYMEVMMFFAVHQWDVVQNYINRLVQSIFTLFWVAPDQEWMAENRSARLLQRIWRRHRFVKQETGPRNSTGDLYRLAKRACLGVKP